MTLQVWRYIILHVFALEHAVHGGVSSSHVSFSKCNNRRARFKEKYKIPVWDYFGFKLDATAKLNEFVVCSNRDDF